MTNQNNRFRLRIFCRKCPEVSATLKPVRSLPVLVVLILFVLSACCPAPQAGASGNVGTETAFVAQVLESRQDVLVVRSEAAPGEILSVSPAATFVQVGARVYVRGLLSGQGKVTRAEISVLTAHD